MNRKLFVCKQEWEWKRMGIITQEWEGVGIIIKLRREWDGYGNNVKGIGRNETKKGIPMHL